MIQATMYNFVEMVPALSTCYLKTNIHFVFIIGKTFHNISRGLWLVLTSEK